MPSRRLKDRLAVAAKRAIDPSPAAHFHRAIHQHEDQPNPPAQLAEGQPASPKPRHLIKEEESHVPAITPLPDNLEPGRSGGNLSDPGRGDETNLSPAPERHLVAQAEPGCSVAPRRDSLGFTTDAMPHITAHQLRWLTYRLESGDNLEACEAAQTDPLTVLTWMGDPDFAQVYQAALDNKREGFRTLTTHLLPSVIRSLQGMLDTGSNKDKKEAAALVLRAQGLLVDKSSVIAPDAISTLFNLLREERPVEAKIIDMTSYRTVLPGD